MLKIKGEEEKCVVDTAPKYPQLAVDLSKADYVFGVESKVHGQMKSHFFPKSIRRAFTREVQRAATFAEEVAVARRWVTVRGV